jgi:hypothetical protein
MINHPASFAQTQISEKVQPEQLIRCNYIMQYSIVKEDARYQEAANWFKRPSATFKQPDSRGMRSRVRALLNRLHNFDRARLNSLECERVERKRMTGPLLRTVVHPFAYSIAPYTLFPVRNYMS